MARERGALISHRSHMTYRTSARVPSSPLVIRGRPWGAWLLSAAMALGGMGLAIYLRRTVTLRCERASPSGDASCDVSQSVFSIPIAPRRELVARGAHFVVVSKTKNGSPIYRLRTDRGEEVTVRGGSVHVYEIEPAVDRFFNDPSQSFLRVDTVAPDWVDGGAGIVLWIVFVGLAHYCMRLRGTRVELRFHREDGAIEIVTRDWLRPRTATRVAWSGDTRVIVHRVLVYKGRAHWVALVEGEESPRLLWFAMTRWGRGGR